MGIRFFLALGLLLGLAVPRANAIIISGTDPNASQWSASGLTGLAYFNDGSSGSCSGAFFEPSLTYVITAAHCIDQLNTPSYIANNNAYVVLGTGGSGGSDLVSGYFIAPGYTGGPDYQDDIAILQLATPAPAGTQYYPIFSGDSVGALFALAGYGDSGTGDTGISNSYPYYAKIPRVGYNVYDFYSGTQLFYDFQDAAGNYNAFQQYDQANGFTFPYSSFVPNEATIGPGDSGGPSLVCVDSNGNILNTENCTNGTLEIAGIHDLIGCFADSSGNCLYSESSTFNDGYGSYAADTNASLFSSFIDSTVNPVSTPEPGTFGILGLGLACLFYCRRMRG